MPRSMTSAFDTAKRCHYQDCLDSESRLRSGFMVQFAKWEIVGGLTASRTVNGWDCEGDTTEWRAKSVKLKSARLKRAHLHETRQEAPAARGALPYAYGLGSLRLLCPQLATLLFSVLCLVIPIVEFVAPIPPSLHSETVNPSGFQLQPC